MPSAARAETYTILDGELVPADGGPPQPLAGSLSVSWFDSRSSAGATVLLVDDFALEAGGEILRPAPPVEYEGLTPLIWAELADAISLLGAEVGLLFLRADGGSEQLDVRDLDRSTLSFGDHPLDRGDRRGRGSARFDGLRR